MKVKDFQGMLGIHDVNECCFLKFNTGREFPDDQQAYTNFLCGRLEAFDQFIVKAIESNKEQRKAVLKSKYVFVFFGLWTGSQVNLRFLKKYEVRKDSANDEQFEVKGIPTPSGLEKRMIIKSEHSRAVIRWQTIFERSVIKIEPKGEATEFVSYEDTYLTHDELEMVIKDGKWQDMLSRCGAVYVIHDSNTGKNYVGAAYGTQGVLGRWSDYAKNPTGRSDDEGNKKLVALLRDKKHRNGVDEKLEAMEYAKKHFKYSILEALPLSNSQRIIDAEVRWKTHLGTNSPNHLN